MRLGSNQALRHSRGLSVSQSALAIPIAPPTTRRLRTLKGPSKWPIRCGPVELSMHYRSSSRRPMRIAPMATTATTNSRTSANPTLTNPNPTPASTTSAAAMGFPITPCIMARGSARPSPLRLRAWLPRRCLRGRHLRHVRRRVARALRVGRARPAAFFRAEFGRPATALCDRPPQPSLDQGAQNDPVSLGQAPVCHPFSSAYHAPCIIKH
jgi:hypothetical protein